MRRRPLPVVWLAVALLVTGACSAPVDSGPRTLREASLPAGLREETSTTTTVPVGETAEVTVYFINGDRLAPVKRRVTPPVTLEKVLQRLFAGPTIPEQVSGLRSALSLDTVVLGAPVDDEIATINLSKDFAFGPVTDQIIAFAQVVFTAVDVGNVTGVLFSKNGKRLEGIQGDGSSTPTPLSRAAYPLVTPR